MKDDDRTVDMLVHPVRWISDTRYRNRMLSLPTPPHTWRFVCRDPEGGIQVVACVVFLENGTTRTMRARLKDVKR
jgi:hypothetical protein